MIPETGGSLGVSRQFLEERSDVRSGPLWDLDLRQVPDLAVQDELRPRYGGRELPGTGWFDEHVVLAMQNQGGDLNGAEQLGRGLRLPAKIDVHQNRAMPGCPLKLRPAIDDRLCDQ